MKNITTFGSLVVILFLLLAAYSSQVVAFRNTPIFTLDYSKPPNKRWIGAIGTVLQEHSWSDSFGPLVDINNSTIVQKLSAVQKQSLRSTLQKYFPANYEELQGIAQDFANNGHPEFLDMEFLSVYVFYHEIAHATDLHTPKSAQRECSGILALPADPNLSVLHGRNLDQSIHPAKNVTLQIEAIRSGRRSRKGDITMLYQAVDFCWLTSLGLSRHKKKVTSLSKKIGEVQT